MKRASARRRIASRSGPQSGPALAHGAIALLVVAGVVAAARLVPVLRPGVHEEPAPIGYSAFIHAMESGSIESVSIRPGAEITGRFRDVVSGGAAEFLVVYPLDDVSSIADQAARKGIAVSFVSSRRPVFERGSIIALQVALAGGLFAVGFLVLRGQGLGGRVGQQAADGDVTFADVAGTQGSAEELREIVDFLADPEAFRALGARVPKGVLLAGPPGTGKTLLARAAAGEARVPFFHLSGSEVTGFVVGLGAHRIRSLFARARRNGGVIFIDEIDALGGSRGSNRAHNEDDRTLNQLLVEMDGFQPSTGVVVIAATNRPDDLDPALKRPGRFDRVIAIGLPTADGREAILRLHAAQRALPLATDVDFHRLARLTPRSQRRRSGQPHQ